MNWNESIQNTISWTVSGGVVGGSVDDLILNTEPQKYIVEITLKQKVKIKGKQYARPFLVNKVLSGEAYQESIVNIKTDGLDTWSMNLTGIGDIK